MRVYDTNGMLQTTAGVNPTRTIFLSLAGGWVPTTLPDAGPLSAETTIYKVNFKGSKFVASAATAYHEFAVVMPGNYDGGTITAIPVFYTASTNASSNTIIWQFQAVAFKDGDSMDTMYGATAAATTTVASSIADKIKFGSETSAITINNSPQGGSLVQFRVGRNGDDTFTGDVILLGIRITYTTNSYADA